MSKSAATATKHQSASTTSKVAATSSSSAATTPQKLGDAVRAGLRLPVARTADMVRRSLPRDARVGKRAGVVLTAYMEYLFGELFADACERTHGANLKSVQVSHLEAAMANDTDLGRVLRNGRRVLVGSERVRPIHEQLKLYVKKRVVREPAAAAQPAEIQVDTE